MDAAAVVAQAAALNKADRRFISLVNSGDGVLSGSFVVQSWLLFAAMCGRAC